jgi:diaminohydroxyphosphoribosylaminopyrimidine deaminase / 5-amino-6-(5-phosphoribosylamino)uracil reductase
MVASSRVALGSADAWSLLLALAERARAGRPVAAGTRVALGPQGALLERNADDGAVRGADFLQTLELYSPLCFGGGDGAFTIAHLAQTLDGRIALNSGRSQFISCQDDLLHTHRLRALADVVLVGRRTVEADDPKLTTRLCPGPNPARAVIDPGGRLREDQHAFRDGGGTTLVFSRDDVARARPRHGKAEVVGIAPVDGKIPVQRVVAELRRRGLRRILVEGGGVTVSRFIEAGVLDRLQITVVPRLFGSGISSVSLPEIAELSSALALSWRTFVLGSDVLFDCTFET